MLACATAVNGLVTGCALGVVAISFSLIYATTKIFHVAHAGVYTLAGYLAWSLVQQRRARASSPCWSPSPPALLLGALIQGRLYAQLERGAPRIWWS